MIKLKKMKMFQAQQHQMNKDNQRMKQKKKYLIIHLLKRLFKDFVLSMNKPITIQKSKKMVKKNNSFYKIF